MSTMMEDDVKRWTGKRKAALVLEILQGKVTVAEASRRYDITPSQIESWLEDGQRGMENALRANPLEVKEQYDKQLKELQQAYGDTKRALFDTSAAQIAQHGALHARC
jgi:transposase-like protein